MVFNAGPESDSENGSIVAHTLILFYKIKVKIKKMSLINDLDL